MAEPALITSEKKSSFSDRPILIVDKIGVIAEELLKRFFKDTLIVLVSQKPIFNADGKAPKIIHIPYVKKFPAIPDNTYSYIFVIDHDLSLVKDSLSKFLEKAASDNAEIAFVFPLSEVNPDILEKISDGNRKAKIFIYGDIFDRKPLYKEKAFRSSINKFIYQAKTFGRIEVLGVGLSKTYPVFLEDVASGIMEGVFGYSLSSLLFYLFPKYPLTELSLAHQIQKIDPLLRLDFVKEKKEKKSKETFLPKGGTFLLGDKYDLGQKIKEIKFKDNSALEENGQNYFEERKDRHFAFYLLFFAVFSVFLPFLTTFSLASFGGWALNSAKEEVLNNDFENASASVRLSKNLFILAKSTSKVALWEGKFLGLDKTLYNFARKIDAGENLSLSAFYFLESQKRFLEIFDGKSKNPKKDLFAAQDSLKKAALLSQKTEGEKELFFKMPMMEEAANVVDVLPALFGADRKKTYLVLFQNNMELRPGGGFVGSYGLLEVGDGRVIDFSIHDVYDADGQLKGHVEPPYPIRRFLPSPHWYLRDSNFDPDFPKSASSAAFFLGIEKGETADGVIGIDVSFVKNILSVLGPIYVADYKEEVTKDNLFELAEKYAEKDFFPGSSQKKDFLRSLFTAIQLNISSKKIPYVSLLKALRDSLKEKHLLFAFRDKSLQNIFTLNNWSSSLLDKRSQEEGTVLDFFGISEANLGVNKANAFIKRSVSQKMTLNGEGTISGELTLFYKNTSTGWPGGDYKNYLRIILPLGSVLSEVVFDNVEQKIVNAITDPLIYESKSFVSPKGLEVERKEEYGKTIFGFLTNVSIGGEKTIIVKYNLGKKISSSAQFFTHRLRFFKQPGTEEYPYSFSFEKPSDFKIIGNSQPLSLNLKGDLDIVTQFTKE